VAVGLEGAVIALRLFEGVRRRRWAALGALLVATGALGWRAALLPQDNSLDVWLPRGDEEAVRYREFRERFSVTDPLLVCLPSTRPVETESLVRRIRRMEGVSQAHILEADGGCVVVLFPAVKATAARLAALSDEVPKAIDEALPGEPRHFGGVWWLNRAIDAGSDRAVRTLLPVVLGLMAVTLLALLRDARDAALCMASGTLPAVQLAGLMEVCGQPMNLLLAALPPLTIILGLTYSVHLLMQSRGAPPGTRMRAFAGIVVPTLAAAGTTVLGFASLVTGTLAPIRALGLWGSVGVLLSLVTTFILVPASARETSPPPSPVRGTPRLGRRWPILAASALLVLALVGGERLRTESHILSFFAETASVRLDYRAIEDRGLGLTPIELCIDGPGDRIPRVNEELERLAGRRSEITHVVWSGADGPGLPHSMPGGIVLRLHPLPEDRARWLASRGATEAGPRRVTLFTRTLSTEGTLGLLRDVEGALDATLGPSPQPRVTGTVALLVRMQALLSQTLVWSFASAFLTVGLVMIVTLRSVGLGLFALVPNVLPVVWLLGAMGWIGVPLDLATVAIASIAFGVLVDDTIHFLHAYRELREAGHGPKDAIRGVLARSGRAMAAATTVTGVGFLGFVASPFVPLRNFGLLTSLTLWLGLACDLVLLPSLILAFRRKEAS